MGQAVLDRIPLDSYTMLLPLRKKRDLFRMTRHVIILYAVTWTLFGEGWVVIFGYSLLLTRFQESFLRILHI
jgi:hypothetical protein